MTDWNETITTIYREATAEAIPAHGPKGVPRQETLEVAAARVATEIRAGRLNFELDTFIRSELIRVDENDGQRSDKILKAATTGQGWFSLESDDFLDVIVTLGGGLRKPWRDVTADNLREMDTVRYRNVKNVQDAYDEWRSSYDAALPVLFRFGTFGQAVDAGGFPPPASESAAA